MHKMIWQSGPEPSFDNVYDKQIDEWLGQNIGNEIFNPGLERIGALAKKIVWKHQPKAIVIIAGTNGKGQTSHDLSYLMTQNEVSWSLWTSPHVLSVTERFKSSAGFIERKLLLFIFNEMHQLARESGIKLSYYEFLFLCFLHWTASLGTDYLILEVGLGGRLDAVNIFNADMVLIPSISRDHTAILGNSLKQILYEKLGVTRSGHRLLHTLEQAYLRREVEIYGQKHGLLTTDLWPEIKTMGLQHNYVQRNRLLSLKAANGLLGQVKVPEKWPTTGGRQDKWHFEKGSIVFTGSHNLDGHRKFISHTIETANIAGKGQSGEIFERVIISFSDRPLKEVETIIDLYLSTPSFCHELLVSPFNHPKAMDVKKYYMLWTQRWGARLRCLEQWNVAIEESLFKNPKSIAKKNLLVSGSYYFVGEVQKYLFCNYPRLYNIDYSTHLP